VRLGDGSVGKLLQVDAEATLQAEALQPDRAHRIWDGLFLEDADGDGMSFDLSHQFRNFAAPLVQLRGQVPDVLQFLVAGRLARFDVVGADDVFVCHVRLRLWLEGYTDSVGSRRVSGV